jgi:hypothetical protein
MKLKPLAAVDRSGAVAQSAEQPAFNRKVEGSLPFGSTHSGP